MNKLPYAGTDTKWLKKGRDYPLGKPILVPSDFEFPPILIKEQERRIQGIIRGMVNNILEKCKGKRDIWIDKHIEMLVIKYCDKIIKAVETKEGMIKEIEILETKIKERKKDLRNRLNLELRSARSKLQKIKKVISLEETQQAKSFDNELKQYRIRERQKAFNELLKLRSKLRYFREDYRNNISKLNNQFTDKYTELIQSCYMNIEYPPAPPAILEVNEQGFGLPNASGIYFIWSDNEIVYVGQSVKLCSRAKLGSHNGIKEKDKISFILFDKKNLIFAECYYIGLYKPSRNKGVPR